MHMEYAMPWDPAHRQSRAQPRIYDQVDGRLYNSSAVSAMTR